MKISTLIQGCAIAACLWMVVILFILYVLESGVSWVIHGCATIV